MEHYNKQRGGALGWLILIIIIIVLVVIFTGKKNDKGTNSAITQEEAAFESAAFRTTVTNTSSDQILSPGVYAVHTKDVDLDFLGELSPASLESLAEYGRPNEFASYVASLPGVMNMVVVEAPILPGETTEFRFSVQEKGLYLSGFQMAVGSNDGFAFVDKIALDKESIEASAVNYDNGTEENSDLNRGFNGGQPDTTRGSDNIENGTATNPQEPVSKHKQLGSSILQINISS
jgi:hypothetical protein